MPRSLHPARAIPDSVRREVLDASCAYCGGPFPTEVDHILPVSRGGTADRENLAPACSACNGEKLDFTPEEWKVWRLSMGWCWPPKSRVALIRELMAQYMPGLDR